jgi:hypothetical protein
MFGGGRLKVCLTEPLLAWTLSAVAELKAMAMLDIIEVSQAESADIVLHYGDYPAAACEQHGYGRLGFWFLKWANSDFTATDAARRSAAAGLALEVGLWVRYSDGRCECLYQSFGFLEPFALKRSVARALAKAAFFPVRVLASYSGQSAFAACHAETVVVQSSACLAYYAELSAIVKKIVLKLLYKEQWYVVVGIRSTSGLPVVEKANWHLDPGTERFWADPFPLEYQGRQWVFVEDVPYASWRGHLSAIELFNDGSHSAALPVMVMDKHQSYPFVFTWNDELYLLPESSAARNVVLWKCEAFPDRWQHVAVLLSNVYMADATLIEYQGRWWMFAAVAQEGACIHDELHMYFAKSPIGPWQAHPQNPVKSDARNARPAGNLFIEDGVLYRPAQDCSVEYGKATIVNRVDQLDTQVFSETPITKLDSQCYNGFLRTHTLSRSQNLWAVDGYRLLPRWCKNGFFSKATAIANKARGRFST